MSTEGVAFDTADSSERGHRVAGGWTLGLRRRVVDLPSGRCAYVDEGEGPAVVLLHGAPLTSLGFVRVIRELRKHHRVIAPDFPGWGGSSEANGFGRTLDDYSDFVVTFIQELGLRGYYVFVHDSSACIGLSALSRAPAGLSGVIISDTVPIPLKGRSAPVKFVLKHVLSSWLVRFLNRHLNLLAWMVATVAPFLKAFSRQERRVLISQFDTKEKRDRALHVFEQMGADEEFMARTAKGIRQSLSTIPALILYGQLDPMRFVGGPGHFRREFPRSSVEIIPLEEHFPILGSGERVGRLVHEWTVCLGELPSGYGSTSV